MSSRLRSMTRSGSIVVLAGLVLGLGCGPTKTRGRPFAIPVPLQLQNVVAVDKQGNQILAGSFAGKLQIAGGELASAGGTDIFIAKADKAGKPVFPPQRFGGKGDDAATGIAVDDDGSIVLGRHLPGRGRLRRAAPEGRRPPRGPARRVRRPAGPRGQGRLGQTDRRRQLADPGQRRRRPRSQHRGRCRPPPAPSPRKTASWRWQAKASCWSCSLRRAIRYRQAPGFPTHGAIVPGGLCSLSVHDRRCAGARLWPRRMHRVDLQRGSLLLRRLMGFDLRRRGRFRLPVPMRLRPASASRATRSIPMRAIARLTSTAWIPTAERPIGIPSVSARLAASAAPRAPRVQGGVAKSRP